MSHQAISALVNLALPIECLGLFLAWSDLRKWSWVNEAESFIDNLSKRRKKLFGGFTLGFEGIEFIAGIVVLVGFYFFGVKPNLDDAFLVYGIAALLLLGLPFFSHALNLFGKDRAIGSVGVILASIGVAIEVFQKYA